MAVDNLLEKLAKNKIRVIRIGHPARVQVITSLLKVTILKTGPWLVLNKS